MTVVVTEGGGGSTGSGMGSLVKDVLPIALLLGAGYLAYKMLFSGPGDTSGSGGGGTAGNKNAVSPGANVGTGTPGLQNPVQYWPTAAPQPQIQPVNVEGGRGTPIAYWPGGQGVISYSSAPTPDMIAETYANLARNMAGITNAWYQPQTLTNPGNWGINSAGSPQSNIAPGVRHCAGPGPGAPPTDSWHYCGAGE